MDIELKAPGYPVQKKSKDTKNDRKFRQADDSELLVGTVAALAIKAEKERDGEEDEEGTSEGTSLSGEGSEDEELSSDDENKESEDSVEEGSGSDNGKEGYDESRTGKTTTVPKVRCN